MSDYDDRMAEEAAREQELEAEIAAYRAENAALEQELSMAIHNIQILTGNVGVLEGKVHQSVSSLDTHVVATAEDVQNFYRALTDMSEQYFMFKNLSTASKNLTTYTDAYYTRFSFYNKLRRIALGYVIGLDSTIISDESLRLEVEKAYLQNTDYWLAYAIMAVTLWAENERDGAERAMHKALSMDYFRSTVFFLLINLRFERNDAAKDWYLNYLDKVDMTRLGDEFQYLLQAYLNGLFGKDENFETLVSENFQRLLQQAEATSMDFADKFTDGAESYAAAHLHRTEETFPTLKEVSPDYKELVDLLSQAEKHTHIAKDYIQLAELPGDLAEEQAQRVENVLYGLISGYDDEEWKVVKEQKRNEAIMEAKGDLKAAQEKYELLYAHLNEKKPLSDLMVTWAFSEDPTVTNNTVKRFTISMMKERLVKGYERFAETYRKRERQEYNFQIDGCELKGSEADGQQLGSKLDDFYAKTHLKKLFADKQIKIYSVICLAALLILVIMAFSFSPVALTIGVLAGVLGGFLLWRRIVDVNRILEEQKRLAHTKLQQALEELSRWRSLYRSADKHLPDIQDALDRF